ncbi:hypothetical protein Q5752_005091 [Cryptotrichosporon argae]
MLLNDCKRAGMDSMVARFYADNAAPSRVLDKLGFDKATVAKVGDSTILQRSLPLGAWRTSESASDAQPR